MAGEARITTDFGDVVVPLDDEQWDAQIQALGSDGGDGWDVAFVVHGLKTPPTAPVIVGVVVRVPGALDPIQAVTAAQEAIADANPVTQAECDLVRCIVHEYDRFGIDDADD